MSNANVSDTEDEVDDQYRDADRDFPPRSVPDLTFEDVDGLGDRIATLQRTVCRSLRPGGDPGIGTVAESGVSALVHGPPGVGKTQLARALAGTVGADLYHVRDPDELGAERGGELPDVVAELAGTASPADPAVVLLDSGAAVTDSRRALTRTLETLRETHAGVAVLGTLCPDRAVLAGTERWLRAFDVRIEVPVPDEARRRAVLESTLAGLDRAESDAPVGTVERDGPPTVEVATGGIATVVESTEGFDVRELRDVVRRAVPIAGADTEGQATDAPTVTVETEHLEAAVEAVRRERAEHLRSGGRGRHGENTGDATDDVGVDIATVPEVSYDDVGGLDEAKRTLREAVEFPGRFPGMFEGTRLDAGRGILLSGPPGTGKTMLARALAHETDRTFFSVAGPELQDKYVGETERRIRELFDSAREHAPSIVFFDEFDSLAPRRADAESVHYRDFVNALLAELDGLEAGEDVVVLAATNRPDALDPAVLRPGRIDRHVEVPPPDRDTYADVVRVHLRDLPTAPDLTPEWVADSLPGDAVGADIAAVCERAAYAAMRTADRTGDDTGADAVTVTRRDVETALAEFDHRAESDGEMPSTPSFR